MGKLNDLKAKIADGLEISEEVATELPKVSVVGKRKIIIENHKGIISFDKLLVKIASSLGVIVITGDGFEVLFMGDNTIIIAGNFHSLNYGEEN